MHNPGMLAINVLGTISAAIPLIFHIPHRNIGVISLCGWTVASCFFASINAIIWDEVQNPVIMAPGYCDIVSRICWVTPIAVVSSGIVVVRQLFNILSAKTTAFTTVAARRRQVCIDLATIFVPVIYVLLLQGVVFNVMRYAIVPSLGCQSLIFPATPSVLALSLPGPILGTICAAYAGGVLWKLWRKRREFREILRSSGSGISNGRFIRLVVLCAAVIVFFYPPLVYGFVLRTKPAFDPETAVPYDWALFRRLARIVHVSYGDTLDYWPIWIFPTFACCLGPLFGTGNEALALYAKALRAVGLGPVLDAVSRRWQARKARRASRLGSRASRKSLLNSLGSRLSAFSGRSGSEKRSSSDRTMRSASGTASTITVSRSGEDDRKDIMVSRDTEIDIDLEALINTAPSPIRPAQYPSAGLDGTLAGGEKVEVIDKMPVSITRLVSETSDAASSTSSARRTGHRF